MIKNIIKNAILFSLMALSFTSCATIVNGTTQRIPVSSDPIGAHVFVDGVRIGCTPVNVELKRKYDHLITISKAGYEDESIRVEPVISGAVAGNIVAGGFIGWGVDAVNGSQYRLIPEVVQVRLRPFNSNPYNPVYSQPAYSSDTHPVAY